MKFNNTKRQWGIDFLRFFCMLCVLFNHQAAYLLFTTHTGNTFYIYAILSSISKIAVPVFFMISGALLLGKEERLKDLLIKRFLKFSVILFIFSVIMYVMGKDSFNVRDFLNQFISGNVYLPYWFLYRYLVFLLCVPLLRNMVKGMPSSYYCYILIMYLIFNSLTETLNLCWPDFVKYGWPFNIQGWLYVYIEPLLGYYILTVIPDKDFKINRLAILGLLALLALGMNAFLVQYDGIHNGAFRETYISTWSILVEIFIVYFVKYIQLHSALPQILQNCIIILGKVSFGVYLLEAVVKRHSAFIIDHFQEHMPTLISSLIYILIIYLIGGAITLSYYYIKGEIFASLGRKTAEQKK